MAKGWVAGVAEAGDVLKTGKGEVELLWGKVSDLPPEWINFFNRLHATVKNPTKRGHFEFAMAKQMEWYTNHGFDVRDPLIQAKMGESAYEYANRSIFLQQNIVVTKFHDLMRSIESWDKETGKPSILGRAATTAIRFELPIVRVPTNIIGEAFIHAFGSIVGGVEAATAYARGIEKLKPEQADMVMRHLKKGSFGAAMMVVAFCNPDSFGGFYQRGEKRKPGEVEAGGIRVFGWDVPKLLTHLPILEAMQMAATMRHIMDARTHKSDKDRPGYVTAGARALLSMGSEIPFLDSAGGLQQFAQDPEQWLGRQTESLIVPQAVQQTATFLDKDAEGNKIKRKPEGVLQNVEMGIPGLRQQVPQTGQSGNLHK